MGQSQPLWGLAYVLFRLLRGPVAAKTCTSRGYPNVQAVSCRCNWKRFAAYCFWQSHHGVLITRSLCHFVEGQVVYKRGDLQALSEQL